MTWPSPQPGLVIRYSYLWDREAQAGREEGVKDRPCAVVLARQDEDGTTRVYVLPITHTVPAQPDDALEIPAPVKTRLGLDGERSWVAVSEANLFTWPGKGPESVAYGFLPPGFFRVVRERFLAANRAKRTAYVKRTE